MKVLGYILDNNPAHGYRVDLCEINNSTNFNKCYLGYDKNGFYIEEHKNFNGSFAYMDEDATEDVDSLNIPISPYYVVRLLFEQENVFRNIDMVRKTTEEYTPETVYSMRFGISNLIKSLGLSEYSLSGCLGSYRQITDLISEIRNGQNKGEVYQISYINLMKELDKITIKNEKSIAAQIKSLVHMSYDDIASLRIKKPELARILSLMSQIENHLMDGAYILPISHAVKENGGNEEIIEEIENKIDDETILETKVNSWEEFCKAIYLENCISIEEQNSKYKRGLNRGKLTTFGLDVVPMPGTPKEYSIKK